jgi:hypothetical protein
LEETLCYANRSGCRRPSWFRQELTPAIMVATAGITAIITAGAIITVIAIVGGVGVIATADVGTDRK